TARTTRRMIVCDLVRGRSGTNSTRLGRNAFPRDDATASDTLVSRPGPGSTPGAATTNSATVSPLMVSGTPTAAAIVTSSRATAADSISAGPTRLPALLRVSSDRPWRYQKPSSSTEAQSPCTQT